MVKKVSRLLLASVLLTSSQATKASAASPYGLKQLLAKTKIERMERPFPVPLKLVHIESADGGGWSGILDDRWNSSDAFSGNFRDEFLDGLSYYLRARGFQLSSEPSAMVVKVTIDDFEGRKRINDDGGDLRGSLTLLRNGDIVGKKELFESLSYRDESDERRAFARDLGLQQLHFSTVLFYRLSTSFFRSIEAGILESENVKSVQPESPRPGAPATQTARTESKSEATGLLTIESFPDTAEIVLDGKLIATTPAKQLRLPAGSHVLVLKKNGYQDWTREVMILDGNDVTLKANLDKVVR